MFKVISAICAGMASVGIGSSISMEAAVYAAQHGDPVALGMSASMAILSTALAAGAAMYLVKEER